ncbi:unnamed protein product [Acanthoscelides obtectus]|uniref:Uncharacterized protein n=1 Tax=Acanthoscelides obtectus TaxID=200917 RepID=A0A9P0KBA2_ACAOB|nr:unnamed protein product [Acanthoscelides obtectus]CAK1664240.1 hypothetical protein AOBTE_LOCUS24149 [Acanthoscelides obtectus]
MRQLLLLVTETFDHPKVKKSLGLRSGLYGGWSNNSTFSSVKYSLVFWAVCELALSWWRMILLSGLIFRSSG